MIKNMYKMLLFILFRIGSNKMRISIARYWGVKIGDKCRIFGCNFGSEPYLISIGNNCEITSGVQFITHDGATWIFRKNKRFTGTKYGPVTINDNCMIGINSIILPNIEIGPNSVVGAGSVVTKNIPPNTIYAGNPAKLICSVDEYLAKCKVNDSYIPHNLSLKEKKILLMRKFGLVH